MKIFKTNQYNQGIGKYKLLSTTAGVGSIVTTKVGSYVLISDINKWIFIKWANSKIGIIRENNADEKKVYDQSKIEILHRGLEFIDDYRFVRFIKSEKDLDNLVCLVGIPHMALNESFNTPKWKNHPINKSLKRNGENGISSDFMIKGTHFPKWFKNKEGKLKEISDWRNLWIKKGRKMNGVPSKKDFAPPRDVTDFIREFKIKNIEGKEELYREYRVLDQTNLVLVCPNGHLSDIPWTRFLNWKTQKKTFKLSSEDKGENLFDFEPCCSNPDLKWTESKTKSEGYGSVFIECQSCDLGSGKSNEKPKINLEGINNIQPCCIGQKPWEVDIDNSEFIPYEKCFKGGEGNEREKMQVSLVTANNVYYANGFSSLYIPMQYAENMPKELIDAIEILEERYIKRNSAKEISKLDYWSEKVSPDFDEFLIDNAIILKSDKESFKERLKIEFLNIQKNEATDPHEEYRWQEYRCFAQNSSLTDDPQYKGLVFSDISMNSVLKPLFKKIQRVEELKVTNVQFDFTRVKPKERIVRMNSEGEKIVEEARIGQNMYSVKKEELFAIPGNETYGEGLFFQFEEKRIDEWIRENSDNLIPRFARFMDREFDFNQQGAGMMQKIKNNGAKHFLIHSFSHMLMRELEFSCGYPTASLKERLYISESEDKRMSGVLIYTAEGSEGSMGGLVSQGEPTNLLQIMKKGLTRSIDCSSDPLCWESERQGVFDLNLSACFSCSLVAETACEEMNLGLDRRILIDENFGYFKDII